MSKGLRKNTTAAEEMEGEAKSHSSSHPSEQGSEVLAVVRVLMEEQRQADLVRREEEARKEEKREAARRQEMTALEARLIIQQTAREDRQYEQQLALMREQANIGEKASRLYREGQEAAKKRETALHSISVFREGEDLEEFFLTTERRLSAAEIRQGEWVTIVDSKLKGKMASAWQDINMTAGGYMEAKDRLLRMCGYTPMLAADVYYGFKAEKCYGMTADQLYYRGQQLLRRMLAPGKASEEIEFAMLKGWISTVIPKKARAALEARVVTNATELANALQDHLVLEGGRTEGQAAIFKKENGEGNRDRGQPLTCFSCGKVGHRAADCWERQGGPSPAKPEASLVDSGVAKIVCYTCNEEGHKSPDCPTKPRVVKSEPTWNKHIKAEPKDVKLMRRININKHHDTSLRMKVNSQEAMVLLDSGSSVTVVPETMVAQTQKTGDTVAVKGFGAKKHMLLPMAEIPFKVGSLSWMEPVALAPVEEGVLSEVVYGLNLTSKRGLELVLLANKVELPEVPPEREEPESSREHVVGLVKLEGQGIGYKDPMAEEGQLNMLKDLLGHKAVVGEKVPLAEELESSVECIGPGWMRRLKLLTQVEVDKEEEGWSALRVRRLVVVDSEEVDSPRKDPSVVRGTKGRLEVSQRPEVCSINLGINMVSSTEQYIEEVEPTNLLKGVNHHTQGRRRNRRNRRNRSKKRRQDLTRSSLRFCWRNCPGSSRGRLQLSQLGEMWG